MDQLLKSFAPYLGVVVIGLVLVLALFRRRGRGSSEELRFRSEGQARHRGRQPFVCKGCRKSVMHTNRTLNAWQRGATSFYCNACHGDWIRKHPERAQTPASRRPDSSPAPNPGPAWTSASSSEPGSGRNGSVSARSATSSSYRMSTSRRVEKKGCLGLVLVLLCVPVAIVIVAMTA